MACRAACLNVACAWVVILLPNLDAAHAWKKSAAAAAGFTCRPRELTALTKSLAVRSLDSFDEANGKHLGTWSPGFPELHVDENSPLSGSDVQCSLIFVARGLGEILEDQRNNLNPGDVPLHEVLEEAVSTVGMLAKCIKHILGGACSPKPPPPTMPVHAFERKQWSHTLLKTARDYLDWLQRKFKARNSKINETKNRKGKMTKSVHLKSMKGSGYVL